MWWLVSAALAGERVTILHTNDWQSRLLGSPNRDYTPDSVNDDESLGGVARIATLVDGIRASTDHPVLLMDGGDITMGSMFHLVTRETGGELELMAMLEYDAVTFGNHDFDFRPEGCADMLEAADLLPPIVASNLQTNGAEGLEKLKSEGAILDRLVIDKDGLTIGVIGLLGKNATEVMGQVDPITSADQVETATRMAAEYRAEGVDLVVVLSHSGVRIQEDGSWGDEDVALMRAVPGIDVIVSGHSHTALEEPILIDGRPVVQAGANTGYLGELVLEEQGDSWVVVEYTLHTIDDTTLGKAEVTEHVQTLQDLVSERIAPARFDDLVAEVAHPMGKEEHEHELANVLTDAYRIATGSDFGMTGNGTIRNGLGEGPLQRSDLFLVDPLGIGSVDDSPGYALSVAWFTGEDIRQVIEFLLIGYKTKGPSYIPRISGAEVFVNPRRIPLDQVDRVVFLDGHEIEAERLYSVAMTSYVATFLPVVSELTKGLLSPVMRGADGSPVEVAELYDADPSEEGIQELKAWQALADHVASLPDTDGDGLPNLPPEGVSENRLVRAPSWNLLRNSTWKMKTVVLVPAGLLGLIGLLVARRMRR